MAGKVKLTYFDATALGEAIRWLLSYGNIEFEDIRFKFPEWPSHKPTMPFGKAPKLEMDGKTLHQSVAICRYLATKVGLYGKDDEENVQIDMLVDTFVDLRVEMGKYAFDTDEKSKEAKYEPLVKETVPFYLAKFDAIVKENGGYFVGGKLTWADIHFASYLHFWSAMMKFDVVEKYPNLKALKAKVYAIPQIAAWMAKAPKTDL